MYTIEKATVAAGHKWACAYRVTMSNNESIPNYGELDRWLRQNCKDIYVLVAIMSQHIAGGSTNNATYCPDRTPRIDYYELRCSESDARRFLRVWRIPRDEYKRNMDYYFERENLRQGWVKVNGKNMPIHDLVKKHVKGAKRK